MRTKMRLKLLAAGKTHGDKSGRGETPQGPAARDARHPCPRRSVSNLRQPDGTTPARDPTNNQQPTTDNQQPQGYEIIKRWALDARPK